MPTTLFVQQQHHRHDHHYHHTTPSFGPGGDDCDVHYIHRSKDLYIISEHAYARSLIPPAHCDARVKPFARRGPPPRRFQTPLRLSTQHKAPRPLMATLAYSHDAGIALGGAPGSPPDLTNSKSSKSSSLHSSNLSDVMGPNDLSHFEDINLDDVQGGLGPSSFPMPASPSNHVLYEGPRNSVSSARSHSLPQAHASHSFRDLTSTTKSRYPTLSGQTNGAVRQQSQLHAPTRSMRRGFTSPSAPSLASTNALAAPGRRSRSPSPSQPQAFPSAPRTLSRRSSRNLEVSPGQGMSSRRQSWQHAVRKSAKEREAECDDDDDEVPEDLMMPNVPISPRPIQERSPSPSVCNSPPEASASPATSRPASLRGVSPAVTLSSFSQPSSPNPANMDNNSPPQPLSRQRTHTWEDTYKALDEDARKVTEALEEYQTGLEKEQGIKRQQPGRSRSSSVERKSQSSKKPLPPLRKSDPLIDPFQPSAEKQKHLSRTRPSWLPPKNPQEEKKHLKEYAKIQARIEETLREQAKKEEEEKLAREQVGRKKAEMWETLLLPKFATEIATPSGKATYRQLWWSGIPPKVRGDVWKTAIGNDLEISEITFNVALEKAKGEIRDLGDRAFGGKAATIVENAKTVFPDLKVFAPKSESGEEQPFHNDLVNVCLAYTSYRPDVDTLTGIHHLAGLLLLNMSVPDAFICLGNLLNRPLPLSFLIRDHTAMTAAYDVTLATLLKKAPSLARRLGDLRVEPFDYLQPMFSSLFCDRLPVEHAARLLDVYAIEGDKIMTRAAVGFLGIREGKLYQGGVEDVLRHLNELDMKMHPDDFMASVYEAGKSS